MPVRDFQQRAGETEDTRLNDWLDLVGTRQNIDLLNPLVTLADGDEFYVFDVSTDKTYKVNASTLASYFSVAAGGGSVTSVGLSAPDIFTVSGSPVTTTGTLAFTPTDPGADRIVFWDESSDKWAYLTAGSGLSITGTTLTATGGGTGTVTSVALAVINDDTVAVSGSPITTAGTLTETAVDAGSDKIVFWDDSAGKKVYLTIGTNLSITDTTLNATGGGGGGVTSVNQSLTGDDTETLSGGPITTSGTLARTAVDAGSDQFIFWDDSAGKKVYGTFGTALAVTGTTLNVRDQPYVPTFMLNGAPTSLQCLLRHPVPITIIFPAGLSPSSGIARTAATAQTDLDIKKNGSSVGTVRWAAAGTVATFIMASQTTFVANDILEVFAPSTPDATLANIGVTLYGTRVA